MNDYSGDLATRWKRFCGAVLDGLMVLAVTLPIMVVAGMLQQVTRGVPITPSQQIVLFICGQVVFLAINARLLIRQGQTLGNKIIGTRIVGVEDGKLLPLSRVYGIRYFLISLITQIPLVGSTFSLIDLAFIFRKDKRCIHDLMAGSKVVTAGISNHTLDGTA